jgi:hypothetical protein
MKKLIVILFLLPLFCSSQDVDYSQYLTDIAWSSELKNVILVGTDTFSVEVKPLDTREPGARPLLYGNYLMDNRGFRYEIIDTTSEPTLIVIDILPEIQGYAPANNKIGFVYQSAGHGESNSIATLAYKKLQESAFEYGYSLDMNIIHAHGIEYDSPFKRLVLGTTYIPDGSEVKGTVYWDEANRTYSIDLGNGVALQVGQETQIPVHNNTGSDIINGRVLFGQAVFNDRITVGLATNTERYTALLIATEDILNDTDGLAVELIGRVNDVNTGSLSLGPIYVDTLGLITNTQPVFPAYTYSIGAVVKVGVTDGIIQFRSDGVNFFNSIRDSYDGSIRETFDFRTFVENDTIRGVISNSRGDSTVTLVFSSGWYDFAVPDTINLVAGTAGLTGVLQDNFVYIDEDTRTLINSTSAFPENEFARVAEINLSDTTNTRIVGAYGNQNINNHFKTDDDNGHLIHAFDWIRAQNAGWARTGLAATLTVGASSLQWATTGGKMRQFHKQTIPALDMSLGDYMLVKNDPDYPFIPVLDVGYLTKYSDGSTWNNQWAPFVLWLIGNKTGETSFLVLNIPRDGYQTEQGAIDDDNGYADFSIPDNFTSKGILLGIFRIRRSGTNYTFNLSTGYQDLRGTVPNNVAGIGGGSSGFTDYTQLNQTPAALEALAFQRVDATGVTLENVLAENILLTEFDSTNFTLKIPQVVGLVDSLNIIRDTTDALRVDIDQNASDISSQTWQDVIDNGTATVDSSITVENAFPSLKFKTTSLSNSGELSFVNPSGTTRAFIKYDFATDLLSMRVGGLNDAMILNSSGDITALGAATTGDDITIQSSGTGKLLRFTGFGSGQKIGVEFGAVGTGVFSAFGSPMEFNAFHGHELYNNAGLIARIGDAFNSLNSTFGGAVTAASLNATNGATVGDAPVLDDDVVRLIELTGATEDVDFNSISVGGVDISDNNIKNARVTNSSPTLSATDYTVILSTTGPTKILFPASFVQGSIYVFSNRTGSAVTFRNNADSANISINTASAATTSIAAGTYMMIQYINGLWYQIGS